MGEFEKLPNIDVVFYPNDKSPFVNLGWTKDIYSIGVVAMTYASLCLVLNLAQEYDKANTLMPFGKGVTQPAIEVNVTNSLQSGLVIAKQKVLQWINDGDDPSLNFIEVDTSARTDQIHMRKLMTQEPVGGQALYKNEDQLAYILQRCLRVPLQPILRQIIKQ